MKAGNIAPLIFGLSLVFVLLLSMAVFFAPHLIVFHELTVLQAMRSYHGKQRRAMAVSQSAWAASAGSRSGLSRRRSRA